MASSKLIVLIGYRGSGKSSVGKGLAKRLKWAWSDADEEIEAIQDLTIPEIFAQHGEDRFRELETKAIKNLLSRADDGGQIISLGGGAPMFNDNPSLWKKIATCVYLRGKAETLSKRISGDASAGKPRPSLTDEGFLGEIQTMLDRRSATYESCADFIVDVDDETVEAIVDQITDFHSQV